MDTYSRCRLCLEKISRSVDIFTEDFPVMIKILTGINMDPGDGLPKLSCLQCQREVKSAMLTRYQIIYSHKILLENQSPFNIILDEQEKWPSDCKISDNRSSFSIESNTDKKTENLNISKISFDKDNENKTDLSTNNVDIKKIDIEPCNNFDKSKPDATDYSSNENTDLEHSNDSIENHSDNAQFDNPCDNSETKKRDLNILSSSRGRHNNIYFVRKKIKNEKTKEKILFARRKDNFEATLDSTSAQEYDIKPEYVEFLKNLDKKTRVACPICGKEMYGMNMKCHLITHNFNPVICGTCGKTSKNAQALQDHVNYYHKTTPDRFICDKCGKGFRVRCALQKHEKKEHGGEKDFECTICGKKFFERVQLNTHINVTHKKIRPFKCEYCGKDFGRRTQFMTHQRVHTKETPFHCPVCEKGFKIKQSMTTHLKGVHGIEEEKTVFCNMCDKGFPSEQALRAHVNSRIHGMEKCAHCSDCIKVDYMEKHLADIHGIFGQNDV